MDNAFDINPLSSYNRDIINLKQTDSDENQEIILEVEEESNNNTFIERKTYTEKNLDIS